jgi:hypothetical protein
MQITFPKLRFQDGQDVASRPDTCARADAGKAEGILLSSRGATHGVRPTPCALPPFRLWQRSIGLPSATLRRVTANIVYLRRTPSKTSARFVGPLCQSAVEFRSARNALARASARGDSRRRLRKRKDWPFWMRSFFSLARHSLEPCGISRTRNLGAQLSGKRRA